MNRSTPTLALVALSTLAGCFEADFGWDSEPVPTPPPAATQHSPLVGAIKIPSFPPIGPNGSLKVESSDADGDLASARLIFQNELVRPLSGSAHTITVSGPALGEGYGTFTVFIEDRGGRSSTRSATNVLVDLTPPKIVLGETVVSSTGDLELWVGDAWVLGAVRLEFGGKELTHEFEPGWPKTLGKTWDYSLVKFSMHDLPATQGSAKLVAIDAAGNTKTETFTLDVDGKPPAVSIVSPAAGATLGGAVALVVDSSDDGGGPVWVEVSLGGTPVGNLSGGKQTLTVNTADVLPGPRELVVTATDRAGNESVAKRNFVVQ